MTLLAEETQVLQKSSSGLNETREYPLEKRFFHFLKRSKETFFGRYPAYSCDFGKSVDEKKLGGFMEADGQIAEGKKCEQCEQWKVLSAFHRRKNKTDGRMRICADCYSANLQQTYQRQRELAQQWEEKRRQEEEEQCRREEEHRRREALRRQVEEENLRQQAAWLNLQPERQCRVCRQTLPATAFPCERSRRGGYIVHAQCTTCVEAEQQRQKEEKKRCRGCQNLFAVNDYGYLTVSLQETDVSWCYLCGTPLQTEPQADGSIEYRCSSDWFHTAGVGREGAYQGTSTLCPRCRHSYRKRNRQVNPLCPMCGMPTSVWDFLREYQDFRLDLIKVCCKICIPRFTALSEAEQIRRLRSAMRNAYGESAVIYALHYDASGAICHIGRTKHLTRRMAEYRRNWDKPIHHYSVLEDVIPGALSMERESRWMMHALKQGWPIDNFELFQGGDDGLSGRHTQEELTLAVAAFEPLTAPFEMIEPLLRHFSNTPDARVVHWLVHHP